MKLGCRRNYHKRQVVIRHYANQPVLNVKALEGSLTQEKALEGAFSVIVKTDCETDGALHSTNNNRAARHRAHSCLCAQYSGGIIIQRR